MVAQSPHDSALAATLQRTRKAGAGSPWLVVVADGLAATHPLPTSGRLVVGRAPDCDIQIEDAAISRYHAAIHVGKTLAAEDLGSANGTCVRGATMRFRCIRQYMRAG